MDAKRYTIDSECACMTRARVTAAVIMFLSIVAIIAGCGGGSSTSPVASVRTSYIVAGIVKDTDGNAVSDVEVGVNGGQSILKTGADGSFTIAVQGTPAQTGTPVVIELSRGGYYTAFHTVRVFERTLDNNTHSAELVMKRKPSTSAGATQARIEYADGSTAEATAEPVTEQGSGLTVARCAVNITEDVQVVTFSTPASGGGAADVEFTLGETGSLSAAEVLGATGTITGEIVYGDPTSAADLALFPGEFTTSSDTGNGLSGEGTLITAGFITISLTRADGTDVTGFAEGATALVKMRIPDGITNPETGLPLAAGDMIPVFTYDEDTGAWVVETEGSSPMLAEVGQDADGFYTYFTTTHLTTFNLDWKVGSCEFGKPTIYFVDENNNPVIGAYVEAETGSGWKYAGMVTYDGYAQFNSAPEYSAWQVRGYLNGQYSATATIDSCRDSLTGSTDLTLCIGNCAIACEQDSDCDDSATSTVDTCVYPGTTRSTCTNVDLNKWIDIGGGGFSMGCATSDSFCNEYEKPSHSVTVSKYSIQMYEVTNKEYKRCVDTGFCTEPQETKSETRLTYYGDTTYDDFPVVNVNWDQAKTYCDWVGGRLPTEAEWEYAAGGGSGIRYPWGAQIDETAPEANYANSGDSYDNDTTPVGYYPAGASGNGALDMAGNVWEWVFDIYDAYTSDSQEDPRGPDTGTHRVARGGSFNDNAQYLRITHRVQSLPGSFFSYLGFRCANGYPLVKATVYPSSGYTTNAFQLTCTILAGSYEKLEGRCGSASSWEEFASGTIRMDCTYSSAGSYTPECRADETITDEVNTSVAVSELNSQ